MSGTFSKHIRLDRYVYYSCSAEVALLGECRHILTLSPANSVLKTVNSVLETVNYIII